MQEEDFVVFLKHFQTHTKSSQESKVLVVLDNHSSHLSSHGIILLSFPPHCSHKLQPLDGTVYGPLKKHTNSRCDNWMETHRSHNDHLRSAGHCEECPSSGCNAVKYPGRVRVHWNLAF
ncbi:Pogo transposable element with ZNF domain [Dissostichus eleginoides]|uniref:Pogo transposable element with ZNF domain n=1 Tax=Dissostichus eleginoides TaxID=100907 RepID=A0AAD9EN92_DISEL|nr:Pogo transposable element with ZNF domain [Dissostichus eleginoides]